MNTTNTKSYNTAFRARKVTGTFEKQALWQEGKGDCSVHCAWTVLLTSLTLYWTTFFYILTYFVDPCLCGLISGLIILRWTSLDKTYLVLQAKYQFGWCGEKGRGGEEFYLSLPPLPPFLLFRFCFPFPSSTVCVFLSSLQPVFLRENLVQVKPWF